MNALEIKDLTKKYDDFTLDHLNLTLPSGCIMGLIGENGAGKSTTMKLLLNMIRKDEGSITILGRDNTENERLTKEEIGVVLDEVGLPDCVNVRHVGKIMKHTFRTWDQAKFEELTKQFKLSTEKQFKDYSRGMKMKLGLAIAFSHDSKLLILDEATSGLDPIARDEVVDLLSDFTRDENHSILISSHIVSDLEKLCDYIAFLHQGKLLLCEEKDLLLGSYGIVRCSVEELGDLNEEAILQKTVTPYGAQAIVKRDCIPAHMQAGPITIEELFIYMIKEGR